ncbi:translocation protein Sec62-domain-containing protein [Radiomyces spectabilis]|uniref:translocation protein Sec62-domain-containing protein n=1 Tax=Radiomyces spectabilis TaxID=64574 RepID=UPI00221F8071|nr:translocation protein Sec62-domain-containing protein [Radiomyces spectabilis]KAI8388391.1 translocation protein Sec62-domain-containing protein [Radiomyces spectabilis]
MSHVHGPGCDHGDVATIHVSDANKAPAFLKTTANYLRDAKASGVKARQGVFNGKRVEYFKGKSALNALLKEEYAKITPKNQEAVTTREAAANTLHDLGKHGFILCVQRGDGISGKGSPRVLQPKEVQEVREDGYYMWIWEGSQWKIYVGAVALVATILAGVLFPLWPAPLRLGVWYLSVGILGLLGVFFGIAIVRLILYIISLVVLPRGFWLFPNLFEDVGVVESFIPLYGWDEKKSDKSSPSSAAAHSTTDEKES